MRILITAIGSVLGQSILKSLSISKYRLNLEVYITDSNPILKEFAREFCLQHNLIFKRFLAVPHGKSLSYQINIKKIIQQNRIELLFAGSHTEFIQLANIVKLPQLALHNTEFIHKFSDKISCIDILKKNNIATPKTFLLSPSILHQMRKSQKWLIKPINSSASKMVFKNLTKMDVAIFIKKNKDQLHEYLVQEFLQGDEITVGCYVDKKSQKASTIAIIRTLNYEGSTQNGRIIKSLAIKKYIEKILIVLKKNGLNYGPINIQLMLTSKGPIIFEINPRFSSTEFPKAYVGFNTLEAYIDNYLNKESCLKIRTNSKINFKRIYSEIFF